MSRSTRSARLIAPAMLLTLLGCGADSITSSQIAPSASVSPSATALPWDQVVFLVESDGAYVPAVNAALESPDLAVYGDGRVIRVDNQRDGWDLPAKYVVAKVDPLLVTRFVAETEALDLITDGTNFGSPPISDMAFTTVRLHGAGVRRSVQVYAFGGDKSGGVSAAQNKARQQLNAVIKRARTLPDTDAWDTYHPDRVRVRQVDDNVDADGAPTWPGPAPESFLYPSQQFGACGSLSGPTARSAYAAARENPGAEWTVGRTQQILAVAALLPGTNSCPS